MPDYERKLWSLDNFDITSAPQFVRDAVAARKWAFAADYIRMYALYTEGGFYLDSDVVTLKRFDDFLSYNFISSVEHHPTQLEKTGSIQLIAPDGTRIGDSYISGMQIQAAVMGAQPGCPFVKDVLDWYGDKHFVKPDGTLGLDVIAPQIYARLAEKFGFKYKDVEQQLQGGMMVYRSETFAGNEREATPGSYAIHYCENSWVKRSFWEKAMHYGNFLMFLLKSKIFPQK